MHTKNAFRNIIFSRLRRLKSFGRLDSAGLNRRVQNELKTRRGVWGAFMPLALEPNLSETYEKLGEQIQFAFPRVIGRELHFYLNAKEFQKSGHGIMEPNQGLRVFAGEMTGVLVPGVAFDQEGNRLGRGRGFYDRFLKNSKAEKIGVCFGTQLRHFATQPHDEKVELLLTENLRLNFRSSYSERNFI